MAPTILLVEDNASDEKLTLLALRRCGVEHEVVVARDGAAAIELLHGPGSTGGAPALSPRLVLLDIKLPKIDGLEVLRILRADPRTALLPVLMLTSSREEQDVRRSYQLGANAYVRKPVEFGDFAEAAKAIGRFWLTVNEPPPPG
jgi:two-component system response regulator